MGEIERTLAEHSGIRLDIGCGANKREGWVGLDVQALPGVDIVHDVNVHPWPLPDGCALVAVCSHLVEHIPPVAIDPARGTWFPFLAFMDEVWRVLRPGGEFAISCPHGYSAGYLQDPTHCNAINETTWAYFDPEEPHMGGALYGFYRPKPWRLKYITWSPSANLEVILVKREEGGDG